MYFVTFFSYKYIQNYENCAAQLYASSMACIKRCKLRRERKKGKEKGEEKIIDVKYKTIVECIHCTNTELRD